VVRGDAGEAAPDDGRAQPAHRVFDFGKLGHVTGAAARVGGSARARCAACSSSYVTRSSGGRSRRPRVPRFW
jgi:hypothetical protein